MFPLADGEPLWELTDDIREHGLIDDIYLYQGCVLDGRRRQVSCLAAGIAPRYVEFEGDDAAALNFVVSVNLHRRHMTDVQRAIAAAKVSEARAAIPVQATRSPDAGRISGGEVLAVAGSTPGNGELANHDLAAQMQISERSLYRAKRLRRGSPNLQEAVEDGTLSLARGAALAEAPLSVQVCEVSKARRRREKQAAIDADLEAGRNIQDRLGHPVPDWVAPAFARGLQRFLEIDLILCKLQRAISELAQMPGGEHMAQYTQATKSKSRSTEDPTKVQTARKTELVYRTNELTTLWQNLRGTRPYSVCPYCAGGSSTGCMGCGGLGWIEKSTWKAAPDTVKAHLGDKHDETTPLSVGGQESGLDGPGDEGEYSP
jgi:hypothetical protein